MGISLTSLGIVAGLEVMMLIYTLIDPALFGPYIWNYRTFYIVLLAIASISIGLIIFVKQDTENRFFVLNISNPICAILFFLWSIGITYSDVVHWGTIDPAVFMTFSLAVPLSFFMFPAVYATIVIIVDAIMLYLTIVVSGATGPIINLFIFFIFQFVLGIGFLRLKMKLAERIVTEHENSLIDVMTGFANRRKYEEDMKKMTQEDLAENLIYVAMDINGLKKTNDRYGHEAGDRLIAGAAKCMEQCFGDYGRLYRVGGDEFVMLLYSNNDWLDNMISQFGELMKAWSKENGIALSASYGYVFASEYPKGKISTLARVADDRMYESKTRYYAMRGEDRRRRIVTQVGGTEDPRFREGGS